MSSFYIYFSPRITGNLEILRKFKVVLMGDQLTRARLQEAKNLRAVSITPERRFEPNCNRDVAYQTRLFRGLIILIKFKKLF